jgi:hypothetical protein
MMKKILAVLALAFAASASAQVRDFVAPDGSYTFLKDSQGRTILGMGVRPTANPNLGLTMGTPFYDGPTSQWYWYTGTGWTSSFSMVESLVPKIPDTFALGSYSSPFTDLYVARSIQGGEVQQLVDAAAATPSVTIAIPTNGHRAGELSWTATSLSGADQLVAVGSQRWWATDTAGTPVCGINKIGTDGEGHSGGANTLICTWTNVVVTTNCALSVTCTNNLAATQAISLTRRVTTNLAATVTYQ